MISDERIEERIIPARAGFTVMLRIVRARKSDHPRSRGVYAARSQWGAR